MADISQAGADRKLVVGIVIYPLANFGDFANLHKTLSMFCETHVLWKNLDPVWMDSGLSVVPTTTFENCPGILNVLMLPGGSGSKAAMDDREILDFLRDCGNRAHYITSVCSAWPILAAAGLLNGCKTTADERSYSVATEGAHESAVTDNRFADSVIPAGLDFALTLLAKLRGDEIAKASQCLMEHDPSFVVGTQDPHTRHYDVAAVHAVLS